LTHFL